jgi:hypothetical protein
MEVVFVFLYMVKEEVTGVHVYGPLSDQWKVVSV